MARLPKQDTELLEAALAGFLYQKEQVERRIAELRARIGERPAPVSHASPVKSAPAGRSMSAVARRRIALAQKKRWAAYRAGNAKTPAAKPARRVISAAGRARIVAAARKRWAAYRKAQAAAR